MAIEATDPVAADPRVIHSLAHHEALGRVMAAKELLRLERRIARAEDALRVLKAHRERLIGLIGGA